MAKEDVPGTEDGICNDVCVQYCVTARKRLFTSVATSKVFVSGREITAESGCHVIARRLASSAADTGRQTYIDAQCRYYMQETAQQNCSVRFLLISCNCPVAPPPTSND